jgi:hypothetical protein
VGATGKTDRKIYRTESALILISPSRLLKTTLIWSTTSFSKDETVLLMKCEESIADVLFPENSLSSNTTALSYC